MRGWPLLAVFRLLLEAASDPNRRLHGPRLPDRLAEKGV